MRTACRPSPVSPRRQQGVVLIVALVMLVVISMLATFSIRNALSSEGVSGNVRTTQLAQQAAEIALRECENQLIRFTQGGATADFVIQAEQTPRLFENLGNWDNAAPAGVFVLPTDSVNIAGGTVTFRRMPECLVERMTVVKADSSGTTNTTTFLITSRGFGPEVAAGTGRPDGSEVWLQSTLELQ